MTSVKKIASIAFVTLLVVASQAYRVRETRRHMGLYFRSIESGEYEKAIAALDKVLLFSPNMAEAYYEKGRTYGEKLNCLSDARYNLGKYLELFFSPPNAGDAQKLLERIDRDLAIADAPAELPAAPGKHLGLAAADGAPDSRLCAWYYYCYDTKRGFNVAGPDGAPLLTMEPEQAQEMASSSADWHRTQFADMAVCGVDTALAVFSGRTGFYSRSDEDKWAYSGLNSMVRALEAMEKDGERYPRLGLMLDGDVFVREQTNIFNLSVPVDLSTVKGRALFYGAVRDFFSIVPPRFRATVGGRPLVFVNIRSALKPKCGLETFDHMRQSFRADFGGVGPYLVIDYRLNLAADAFFADGADIAGVRPFPGAGEFDSSVVCVGPGYDDSASSAVPRIVPRRDGDFFRSSLAAALRTDARIAVVETWNNFTEGSAVCRTRECGALYIDLLRDFAARWKDRGRA